MAKTKNIYGWIALQVIILVPVLFGISILFMRNPKEHGMFKLAPSDHKVTLKSGVTTTIPFHAYNSKAMIVVGTSNIQEVRKVMKGQDYEPIGTEDGKAIVIFWIMNYPDSTGGPYKELVYAILSTPSNNPKNITWNQDPFYLAKLYLDPSTILYVNKLWLSEQLPIDYGREILGTDKYPLKLHLDNWGDIIEVDWRSSDGSKILEAKLEAIPSKISQFFGLVNLGQELGLKECLKLLLSPVTFTLVSPKGLNKEISKLTNGASPRTQITSFGDVITVAYDTSIDRFVLGESLNFLEFKPELKIYSPSNDFIFFPPIVSPTAIRT